MLALDHTVLPPQPAVNSYYQVSGLNTRIMITTMRAPESGEQISHLLSRYTRSPLTMILDHDHDRRPYHCEL